MANGRNLFISYDLSNPGRNYAAVAEAIKGLGSWAKTNLSYWYVDSSFTASQAAAIVWKAMDSNDKLIVVDSKENEAAWYNLDITVERHIQTHWNI